ncbi:hypothetical protein SAMN06295924_1061 [Rathayibacter rathayi NCPPB 2980 = VKM Ac-1601]|uniref:hypothetical protein n=1 Tax=Rathayibacter rathayi TaxID=33887 RepID=UPI000BD38508|nr:hypothetical protein [Rathayibacter rathayi]AZZ48527.1 hypothetical protein C1O28_04395 [Rathayibacter rathayi]MWV74835.1 hypothetical protein [Rathayibacter rathayi NCPPB 2980 = VKM Ac-1601]PPF49979.1 hypothetical protein C5C08_06470 [Rathayibacter rathayi]PPG69250.1 hypothetical protein C5C16_05910 [Rathayibacter rathayi]PPG79557.1 hypothetical protein C5C15_05550 [Rathayibacter rathayi]
MNENDSPLESRWQAAGGGEVVFDPAAHPAAHDAAHDAADDPALSDELLRIEQAPLPERASTYTRLQEQLRLRLENADRDR